MKTRIVINSIRRRRSARTRSRLISLHPRLSVFRSNAQIYAQIIDDASGRTLVAASSLELKKASPLMTRGVKPGGTPENKTAVASLVGKLIAERAVAAGISEVVFDRGRYRYHGRIHALAASAREHGLKF